VSWSFRFYGGSALPVFALSFTIDSGATTQGNATIRIASASENIDEVSAAFASNTSFGIISSEFGDEFSVKLSSYQTNSGTEGRVDLTLTGQVVFGYPLSSHPGPVYTPATQKTSVETSVDETGATVITTVVTTVEATTQGRELGAGYMIVESGKVHALISGGGRTGETFPSFSTAIGSTVVDGDLTWMNFGDYITPGWPSGSPLDIDSLAYNTGVTSGTERFSMFADRRLIPGDYVKYLGETKIVSSIGFSITTEEKKMTVYVRGT